MEVRGGSVVRGLAPCWGVEAVREAGWRGVAIVDTELAGNVLGDLDMDPGAAKKPLDAKRPSQKGLKS